MKSKETLLIVRQNLISEFKKYERFMIPILRFVMSFSVLCMLKNRTGYIGTMGNVVVLLAIALIGAFASAETIEICAILVSVLFMFKANPIIALILFIALMMMYVLYGRLFPGESILVIVTLVAFSLKLEVAVPIIAALFGSYASIVAIILGVVLWFVIPQLRIVIPSLPVEKDQIVDCIRELLTLDLKSIFANQTMMVICIIFFVVFSVTFIIRKLSVDYGPYIAIIIGAVMNILGFGLATIFFVELHISLTAIIIQTILVSVVATIMQFFSIVLDYQRAETVNFEDEDNYYYVKIIPKIKLNVNQEKVKKVYTNLSQTDNYRKLFMDDDDFPNGI